MSSAEGWSSPLRYALNSTFYSLFVIARWSCSPTTTLSLFNSLCTDLLHAWLKSLDRSSTCCFFLLSRIDTMILFLPFLAFWFQLPCQTTLSRQFGHNWTDHQLLSHICPIISLSLSLSHGIG